MDTEAATDSHQGVAQPMDIEDGHQGTSRPMWIVK